MNKEYDGYRYIEGGVCAAIGFSANGLNCGLNPDKSKNDLGMIYSERLCTAAAVYTQNKVKGAPVLVTKRHLEASGGTAKAVIVNSKNANTCNADGVDIAEEICGLAANALGIHAREVIIASTGVIGQPMSVKPFAEHMQELTAGLSKDGHREAATAIMTTDTVRKEAAVEFKIADRVCRLGGMAKGSGMIHPNMATTLNFITTDVSISAEMLQNALKDIVKTTYNCLSIDGDTSTNDMVSVMANGEAGNPEITADGTAYQSFRLALFIVMSELTKMLAADGEGASKFLECICSGAPDQRTAVMVAKSVIQSSLVKCLMFGGDANWGRIMCAIGYADAEFDMNRVDVDVSSDAGTIKVCRGNSVILPFSEEKAAMILGEKEITIAVNLNQGEAEAKAWGCDLTYDYVKINGDYRS